MCYLPIVREPLGDPITKAAVYDLEDPEQAAQADATEATLTAVLAGGIALDDLLSYYFRRGRALGRKLSPQHGPMGQ